MACIDGTRIALVTFEREKESSSFTIVWSKTWEGSGKVVVSVAPQDAKSVWFVGVQRRKHVKSEGRILSSPKERRRHVFR